MNKRKLIGSIKDCLKLDDFMPISVGAGTVSLTKDQNKFKDEIVISYSKYPGAYSLSPAISGYRHFKDVENILEKYFKTNSIGYNMFTIYKTSRRDESIGKMYIKEPLDIENILPSLREMVFEDIIPFFERYKTLYNVHDEIEKMELSKISKFIYTPLHPRVMIIKRLVGATNWKSYSEDTLKLFEEQSQGKYKSFFAPIYKFLPDLYKELTEMDIN